MKRNILIVNGSESRRRTNRELLQRAGYDVHEIVSVERAMGVVRRDRPLAVLIEAPEDTGIPSRFAERLRRHPKTHDVPVLVLVTGREHQPDAEEVPGVSWLPEPCPPRALLDELAYLTRPVMRAPQVAG
jgi:PleD family two-component response regulator